MTPHTLPPARSAFVTTHDKPLLKALVWQGRHNDILPEEDVLAIYERNWDFAGLLATPDAAELEFIHALGLRYRSWLATVTLI